MTFSYYHHHRHHRRVEGETLFCQSHRAAPCSPSTIGLPAAIGLQLRLLFSVPSTPIHLPTSILNLNSNFNSSFNPNSIPISVSVRIPLPLLLPTSLPFRFHFILISISGFAAPPTHLVSSHCHFHSDTSSILVSIIILILLSSHPELNSGCCRFEF